MSTRGDTTFPVIGVGFFGFHGLVCGARRGIVFCAIVIPLLFLVFGAMRPVPQGETLFSLLYQGHKQV